MSAGRIPTTANSPLTAKGDLFGYSTQPARLAVGSDGDTIVADASTAIGLRWQGDYAAGKNKIINGDFGIWQRGTSFVDPTNSSYTADRFLASYAGTPTSMTTSQQTFTPGTAPVAGYEGRFFFRNTITTVGTLSDYDLRQKIEDVRTFAGQTATLSFYAKADSARTSLVYLFQDFGSGGSAGVISSTPALNVTTSWTRYSFTFNVASVTGKTIGTGSSLYVAIRQASASGSVLDVWGVQIEAGSVATAFQTATGTIQGETSACERYYQRWNIANFSKIGTGVFFSSTAVFGCNVPPKVTFRATPTLAIAGCVAFDGVSSYAATLSTNLSTATQIAFDLAVSGATALRVAMIGGNNTSNAYFEASAEL